jgi:hypothetical protein
VSERAASGGESGLRATHSPIRSDPNFPLVDRFLGELESHRDFQRSYKDTVGIFNQICQVVARLVAENPASLDALKRLESMASQPIDDSFRSNLPPHPSMAIFDDHITFAAVCHWRTLWQLRGSVLPPQQIVEDTQRMLSQATGPLAQLGQTLDKLGPNYKSLVVTEANFRSAVRTPFRQHLLDSVISLRRLRQQPSDRFDPFALPALSDAQAVLGAKNRGQWWHLPVHVSIASSLWGVSM